MPLFLARWCCHQFPALLGHTSNVCWLGLLPCGASKRVPKPRLGPALRQSGHARVASSGYEATIKQQFQHDNLLAD